MLYFGGLAGQDQTYNSKGAWWTHLQGAGRPKDPNRPDRESLALPDVLKLLAEASAARGNFVILDAAWRNPFVAEQENRPLGLAALDAAELGEDTLVWLAARPGTVIDASSEQSSFAAALARHLPLARESIGRTIEAVSRDVQQQSSDQQPWLVAGKETLVAAAWPAEQRSFLESEQPREGSQPGQEWINGLGMTFCWCPPGRFQLGSPDDERSEFSDARPVEVTLSRGFWIGKYEVTLLEGRRAGWAPYPSITDGKNIPMHNLQQGQTKKFIDLLNKKEREAGRLLAEAQQGKLDTNEGVEAAVRKMLDEPKFAKPRIMRFFRQYFGYDQAVEVFKSGDNKVEHYPRELVADTDRLIEWILEQDRQVLRELLTTNKAFVNFRWDAGKQQGSKARNEAVHLAYGLPPDWKWTDNQPIELPSDQRAGILTQPAWLVAQSKSEDNDIVHRSKWIRERLLGNVVPDIPITVDAQLPIAPEKTLRERMAVTEEQYCWQCHRLMNRLGYPFEMYDHYGRFRTVERVLDPKATAENVDSKGEPLGPVMREVPVDAGGAIEHVGRRGPGRGRRGNDAHACRLRARRAGVRAPHLPLLDGPQ